MLIEILQCAPNGPFGDALPRATGDQDRAVEPVDSRDVAALAAAGGRAAGPAPLPPAEPGAAVEVDRVVPPLPVRVACAARTALAPSLTRTNAYFHVLGRTGPADPAKPRSAGPFFSVARSGDDLHVAELWTICGPTVMIGGPLPHLLRRSPATVDGWPCHPQSGYSSRVA